MNDGENTRSEEESLPDAIPLEKPIQPDPTSEVETVRRERDEYLNLLKAKQAEFENYQKRAAKEREQERLYAVSPLVKELLPSLDDLERALAAAEQAGDDGPLSQGVRAIHTKFLDALRRFGVEPINALGQPFDPNLHQAVSQQPSSEYPPQSVSQVYQQGYSMHDRVLRPAMVVVVSEESKE